MIRRLKESSPAELSIGGAELGGQAITAGLVDELRLLLAPVIVGAGKSPPSRQASTISRG